MQTITTYNGITLGFEEVPEDTKISLCEFENRDDSMTLQDDGYGIRYKVNDDSKYIKLSNTPIKFIGTTSTLTELQANDLVEYFELESVYKNYNPKSIDDYWKFNTALKSFNSLLEANGFDLTKTWVVLQIKND